MITRTVHGTRYPVGVNWDINLTSTAEFAIQSFSWIIPLNRSISWRDFANLIESHCEHPKAQYIAKQLRSI